ncbi:MAG: hypothetical protein RLZZ605_1418 [Bacteroidota bacterium]|jgi:hypothetical protein
MKASVRFIENGTEVKVSDFKTKKEARKAIQSYLQSFRITERVAKNVQAYIIDFSSPYCL